jgi:hypothetical protein
MPSHQGYFPPILGASLNPLPTKPMASAHTPRHMAQLLAQLLLLWLLLSFVDVVVNAICSHPVVVAPIGT